MQAAPVAAEHLDIGEEMVAEGHRLGRLQMGESRHDRVRMDERLVGERLLQVAQLRVELVDGVAHPEAEIDRHLIVARARRVQASRRRADDFSQPALDIHMNIFERPREREGACVDFRLDPVEPGCNGGGVFRGDDAIGGEHRHMSLGATDVLRREAVVEADGGVDLLHDCIGSAAEPAAPHLVAHDRPRTKRLEHVAF